MIQVDSGGPVNKTCYILFERGNCFYYSYMSRASHWILRFTIRVATVQKECAFHFSHRLLIGRQYSLTKLFFFLMKRKEWCNRFIIESFTSGVMISVIGIKMYKYIFKLPITLTFLSESVVSFLTEMWFYFHFIS